MIAQAIENGHAEANQMNLPTTRRLSPENDAVRSLWDIVDLYRRNQLLLPPHQRDFVWSEEKKAGWVRRIRGEYSAVRPVGGIVTYQIQGDPNSPVYINDGSQRIRATLDYLSNARHYGSSEKDAEEVLRDCQMPCQHRHYSTHDDALVDFQLLNFGTHLTAYEFYCGVIAYMDNYDLHWKPFFADMHAHITIACARLASSTAKTHELIHKHMRSNYGMLYRFLSKEKGTTNYRANTSKVSMEEAASDKLIERRLRNLLLDIIGPSKAKDELRIFKRFLDSEIALLETVWDQVKASAGIDPKRGINVTLVRWLLDCAIFRRNNEITIDRWQAFLKTVLMACSGTGQFVDPADQRHKITLSLGAVDKLPAVCKMIGSDFYERPERRRVTNNNGKPGYDESHLVSFAENGNGPTFLEPAGVNRARGKKPVDA